MLKGKIIFLPLRSHFGSSLRQLKLPNKPSWLLHRMASLALCSTRHAAAHYGLDPVYVWRSGARSSELMTVLGVDAAITASYLFIMQTAPDVDVITSNAAIGALSLDILQAMQHYGIVLDAITYNATISALSLELLPVMQRYAVVRDVITFIAAKCTLPLELLQTLRRAGIVRAVFGYHATVSALPLELLQAVHCHAIAFESDHLQRCHPCVVL